MSFLVKEDNRVKVRLCAVVPYPPFARVIGVLKVAGKGGCEANGFGWGSGPGNGRLILSKSYWFITIDAVVAHVWFCEVYDMGDKEKMLYHFEIAVSGLKGLVIKSIVP